MSVIAAPPSEPITHIEGEATYEYLLLGELRMLLEEPTEDADLQLWLLAVLDRMLARMPRMASGTSSYARFDQGTRFAFTHVQVPWIQKLRRLRDRVAHRAPFQMLANELRCDLRQLFDQQLMQQG